MRALPRVLPWMGLAGRRALSFLAAMLAGFSFDRTAARDQRLDLPAGAAVHFEPGQKREVRLVSWGGARHVYGFNGQLMGPLDA